MSNVIIAFVCLSQMDSMSSRYEERLVELHSVIAELSRQIEEKSRERIVEEEDDSDDESRQKDVDESEGRRKDVDEISSREIASRSDLGSRTSTDIDAQAVEVKMKVR